MKKADLKVGSYYVAKVSGKLTVVRLDEMRETCTAHGVRDYRISHYYDVTNLRTNRTLTFRSAQKFRREVAKPVENEET